MKSFAIIGLSSFGFYLAKYLSENGHHVMVIDISEEKIEKAKIFADRAVIADASDKEALAGLGLQELDVVVVSLGNEIDASVLVTLYLRELKVKNIIAKAITEDHGKILDIIGATRVVFPERDEAFRLAKTIESEYILDTMILGDGISIIETATPMAFVGRTLKELDIRNKYQIQVLVIKKLVPENIVLIPTGDHVLKDSDILILMGKDSDLEKIKKMR